MFGSFLRLRMWLPACVTLLALALTGATAAPGARHATPKPAPKPPQRVTIKMIALNDFHGELTAADSYRVTNPSDATKTVALPVGGAAYLVSAVRALLGNSKYSIVIGAGDMIGASQLSSALLHDEPAIETINATGMELTSVGNHEFDKGLAELRRQQNGGCFPGGTIGVDTCVDGRFPGASFKYLAANVIEEATGKTIFPPYAIKTFVVNGKRVPIAFIGAVLKETVDMVNAPEIRGLRFTDEAAAINALLPQLRKKGVHAFVVLIHQGIRTSLGPGDLPCDKPEGDLLPILDKLDPSIPLVVSGHTHWPYICSNGQGTKKSHVFYTSAYRYGDMLTDLDVTVDVATDKIVGVTAKNHLVVNDLRPNPLPSLYPAYVPDPKIAAIVQRAGVLAAPLTDRVIGKITADFDETGLSTGKGESGETTIADLVADARLEASRTTSQPCDIGFINPGGVRTTLLVNPVGSKLPPGDVSFGAVYSIMPFGDDLEYIALTGEQIARLLDQQFVGRTSPFIMGVSRGFAYTWDASKPDRGPKVVPGSITLDGKPLDPAKTYRVAIDEFLADGGDAFTVFKESKLRVGGIVDRDSLADYIAAHSPLSPPPRDRVHRLN